MKLLCDRATPLRLCLLFLLSSGTSTTSSSSSRTDKRAAIEKFRKAPRSQDLLRTMMTSSSSTAASHDVTAAAAAAAAAGGAGEQQHARTQCEVIPARFGLCYGIEYKRMRVPNLLGHESMAEILKQSSSWPPLVSYGCHPETRKFLCSVYAPVCLNIDRSVPPCRSLCQSVRDACSPGMAEFGFPWPSILNCTQYPSYTESLCIPPNDIEHPNPPSMPKTCPPCRTRKAPLLVRKKFCHFDFVMKARVKRLSFDRGGTRILISRKFHRVYRWRPATGAGAEDEVTAAGKTPRRQALWMRDGLHCRCAVIDSAKQAYLIMGKRAGRNLIVHAVAKWSRRIRKAANRARKTRCPAPEATTTTTTTA